jgi:hypothetical protein
VIASASGAAVFVPANAAAQTLSCGTSIGWEAGGISYTLVIGGFYSHSVGSGDTAKLRLLNPKQLRLPLPCEPDYDAEHQGVGCQIGANLPRYLPVQAQRGMCKHK